MEVLGSEDSGLLRPDDLDSQQPINTNESERNIYHNFEVKDSIQTPELFFKLFMYVYESVLLEELCSISQCRYCRTHLAHHLSSNGFFLSFIQLECMFLLPGRINLLFTSMVLIFKVSN